MASALINHARFNSVEPKPEEVNNFKIYPGEGVSGELNGKTISIGNRRISIRAGCEGVPNTQGMEEAVTVGYVFLGAIPIGIFSLSDTCRTGAIEGIKESKSMGIKTAMLTGDSAIAAKHAQKQLGNALEVIHEELLPEDKVRIVHFPEKVLGRGHFPLRWTAATSLEKVLGEHPTSEIYRLLIGTTALFR